MTTTLDIKAFMEANPKLLTRKESKRYPGLFVLKYARDVFYDSLWTDELEYCRGLVVDADWNIVVQPFRKIYNRFERGTDFPLDTMVYAYKKINGFMAAVTYIPGRHDLIVSTTGSLDSDFVDMAKEQLFKNVDEMSWIRYFDHCKAGQVTMLFEICHPNDPHIVEEEPGAYALALNVMLDDIRQDLDAALFFPSVSEAMSKPLGVLNAGEGIYAKFSTVVQLAKDAQHEGYVVYAKSKALKIKSPYYLVTKFFARKSEKRFDLVLRGDNWKQFVDEEYYDLVQWLREHRDEFLRMSEPTRCQIVRQYFERKTT